MIPHFLKFYTVTYILQEHVFFNISKVYMMHTI